MKKRTAIGLLAITLLILSFFITSVPIVNADSDENVIIESNDVLEVSMRDIEEDDLVSITVNASGGTVNVYIIAGEDLNRGDYEAYAEESDFHEEDISLTWTKPDDRDYYLVIENPHENRVTVDYNYESVDFSGIFSGFQTCCWVFAFIILIVIVIIIIFLVKYFKGGDDYTDDFGQKGYGEPSYGTDSYKSDEGYEFAKNKNRKGSTRYCKECGWKVEEDANYCEHCGKKLK